FIFRLILILILILVILLVSISVANKIEYAKYDETGIMKNGNLCISHMCEGGGGYAEKYYNSDNNVLQETEDFYAINGIKLGIGNTNGDVFGKVYKPINSGTSDIYVGYSTFGGDPIKYFELYHVEVDKDFNITYSVKTISKEQFEQQYKEE
ncbi:MAG: hypothetical protein K2N49_07315, partial [Ruminococcus sp.]|nr:hypothetical protein [Ruminococcus sp.]